MTCRIALVFTEGVSLKTWAETGVLLRDSLLYERLGELGHEVTFVTWGKPGDEEHLPETSNIRVLTRPKGVGKDRYAKALAEIHGQALADVDLIKSHQFRGARHTLRLARRLKKPMVARAGYLASVFAREQGAPWKRRRSLFLDEFLSCHRAAAVCVPTADDRDYLVRRYLARSSKIHLHPNWIETERFRPMPDVPKSPRRVVFVGRLAPQKQPHLLLEAARRIPGLEILVIGDGPMREELQRTAEREGLQLNFAGRVQNEAIPELLNTAHAFFLPTTHEGSPKALYEAMACGLPVVSTNVVGVKPAFEHGVEGCQHDSDDIAGMSESLRNLIEEPERARAMGEKGRSRVVENFSIQRAIDREVELFRRVLGR